LPTWCCGCAARALPTSPGNASSETAAAESSPTNRGDSVVSVSPLAAASAQTDVGQIIVVTPEALQELVKLRDTEPEGDRLGLRLEIVSNPGEDFRYDLSSTSSPRRRSATRCAPIHVPRSAASR
jgi:hypothetical protein